MVHDGSKIAGLFDSDQPKKCIGTLRVSDLKMGKVDIEDLKAGCELELGLRVVDGTNRVKYGGKWWCCGAEFGKHEPTCPNYNLPDAGDDELWKR